jgi:hypothetical protein
VAREAAGPGKQAGWGGAARARGAWVGRWAAAGGRRAGPQKGRLGAEGDFPFYYFLPFFYFLISNLFTIMSYILNGYTPKQNITQKQMYFRMMHQPLFP